MTRVIRGPTLIGFLVIVGVAVPTWAEPPSRTPVDTLWEQYMLNGSEMTIASAIRDSKTDVSELWSRESFETARGKPETAAWRSYGITVTKLGEGFWGNGGWELTGGLLARASDGPSTFELYGKAVVHIHPYFPLLSPHGGGPVDTGYEFFLLHRQQGAPGGSVVRKWAFGPDEAPVKRVLPDVAARLRYDPATRSATVTITGLNRPFEERVDLSSMR